MIPLARPIITEEMKKQVLAVLDSNRFVSGPRVEQFEEMNDDLGGFYALGNDIDASETQAWNDGKGFVPVGNQSAWFWGSFDGRRYTVKGLYINRGSEDFVGLFGYISESAEIENVGVVDTVMLVLWWVMAGIRA